VCNDVSALHPCSEAATNKVNSSVIALVNNDAPVQVGMVDPRSNQRSKEANRDKKGRVESRLSDCLLAWGRGQLCSAAGCGPRDASVRYIGEVGDDDTVNWVILRHEQHQLTDNLRKIANLKKLTAFARFNLIQDALITDPRKSLGTFGAQKNWNSIATGATRVSKYGNSVYSKNKKPFKVNRLPNFHFTRSQLLFQLLRLTLPLSKGDKGSTSPLPGLNFAL
jgi:hypothetical protein